MLVYFRIRLVSFYQSFGRERWAATKIIQLLPDCLLSFIFSSFFRSSGLLSLSFCLLFFSSVSSACSSFLSSLFSDLSLLSSSFLSLLSSFFSPCLSSCFSCLFFSLSSLITFFASFLSSFLSSILTSCLLSAFLSSSLWSLTLLFLPFFSCPLLGFAIWLRRSSRREICCAAGTLLSGLPEKNNAHSNFWIEKSCYNRPNKPVGSLLISKAQRQGLEERWS